MQGAVVGVDVPEDFHDVGMPGPAEQGRLARRPVGHLDHDQTVAKVALFSQEDPGERPPPELAEEPVRADVIARLGEFSRPDQSLQGAHREGTVEREKATQQVGVVGKAAQVVGGVGGEVGGFGKAEFVIDQLGGIGG